MEILVRDHTSKETSVITAKYVLAADGFHSIIREKLGIKLEGFSSKEI